MELNLRRKDIGSRVEIIVDVIMKRVREMGSKIVHTLSRR